MPAGHIEEIWQYPVKSMAGVRIERALITEAGIPGDRCWAVIDAEAGQIRSAKRWPELLQLAAGLVEQPCSDSSGYGAQVPEALVRLPDGSSFKTRDAEAATRLSAFLGRPARLAALAPPSERSHYQLAEAHNEADIRAGLGLLPGESLPDFSVSPAQLRQQLTTNATPPGTYFDAFPLHLISTTSLAYLADRGCVDAVVQRFRANFLMQPVDAGAQMIENGWVGRRLQIGSAIVSVNSRTTRCSMPARAQPSHRLAADPGLTRALVQHCERRLGINLLVEQAGRCAAGDEILLLD